jgi:hypothetical protein
MRQELITTSTFRRVTSRANLCVVVLVGVLFCLVRAAVGPPGITVTDLAVPFVLLLAHLALDPIPWQWTGTDAPSASLGRGALQALAFNLAWVALLLALLHLGGDHPGPHPMPPGPNPMPPGLPPLPGPPRHPPGHGPWPNLGLLLVNVAFAIGFGWAFAQKEATEVRERTMAGLLRHSRSRALQNQLEPHVLYNALNGLAELVHEDPEAAEEMIARLADLYRTLTHYGEADLVPLVKERLLVESYLAMEDMRLGDRLQVAWDWPPWADTVLLPPLILQPLVENAIKHGISPAGSGGAVRIACARDGEALVLSVANTGRPLPAQAQDGVGLANLKARLELWAEAAGAFTLAQDGEWAVATVRWTARST